MYEELALADHFVNLYGPSVLVKKGEEVNEVISKDTDGVEPYTDDEDEDGDDNRTGAQKFRALATSVSWLIAKEADQNMTLGAISKISKHKNRAYISSGFSSK